MHLLGLLTENKRGYISFGSVLVEGTSIRLFKENKGGYIPCGSLLVKDFTRLLEISRIGGCLGTGCRHGLLPNQYKFLCLSSSSLHSLISAVYFNYRFYFWFVSISVLYFLNFVVKALEE